MSKKIGDVIKMSLFRIWMWEQNDRREVARFKAEEFEDVQQYLLKKFIKEECQDDIELTECGLEWMNQDPEQCLKEIDIEDLTEDEVEAHTEGEYCPCETCEGCLMGYHLEEIEEADGVSWGETWEFKTIQGTNEFYDLTIRTKLEKKLEQLKEQHKRLEAIWERDVRFAGPAAPNKRLNECNAEIWKIEKLLNTEVEKSEDWNSLLTKAWKKDPQLGVSALILSTIETHPELKEGFSKELIERSKKDLEQL